KIKNNKNKKHSLTSNSLSLSPRYLLHATAPRHLLISSKRSSSKQQQLLSNTLISENPFLIP
ncbi:hypothetical protein GIB67_015912, partial [Kingdonia uniflora]